MKRHGRIVLFFGALILIWALAVASGRWSAVILPSPESVAEYLWGATLDGSLMLLHQGALAFEAWTGRPAPRAAMARALRAAGLALTRPGGAVSVAARRPPKR